MLLWCDTLANETYQGIDYLVYYSSKDSFFIFDENRNLNFKDDVKRKISKKDTFNLVFPSMAKSGDTVRVKVYAMKSDKNIAIFSYEFKTSTIEVDGKKYYVYLWPYLMGPKIWVDTSYNFSYQKNHILHYTFDEPICFKDSCLRFRDFDYLTDSIDVTREAKMEIIYGAREQNYLSPELMDFLESSSKIDLKADNLYLLYNTARWCGPCQSARPKNLALEKQLSKFGVQWISLVHRGNDDLETLDEFVLKIPPPGITVLDQEVAKLSVFKHFRSFLSIPDYYLIRGDGLIIYHAQEHDSKDITLELLLPFITKTKRF